MVVHAYYSGIWGAEAGASEVQSQPKLHDSLLTPNNRENQLFLAEECFMNSYSFVSPSKETNQIHTDSVNYDDS